MSDGRAMSSRVRTLPPRPDPVPPEYVAYDGHGHIIDRRTGQRLEAHGANQWREEWVPGVWPAKSVITGQGWYPAGSPSPAPPPE